MQQTSCFWCHKKFKEIIFDRSVLRKLSVNMTRQHMKWQRSVTLVAGWVCHQSVSCDSYRFIRICLTERSLSLLSLSIYQGLSGCFVSVLFWHLLLKNINSQSALSTSCSLQLLSSWSSWPWWPSVTLQSLSALMKKSPTRQHLQVHHTFMSTANVELV